MAEPDVKIPNAHFPQNGPRGALSPPPRCSTGSLIIQADIVVNPKRVALPVEICSKCPPSCCAAKRENEKLRFT